jgi:hypothetical protein
LFEPITPWRVNLAVKTGRNLTGCREETKIASEFCHDVLEGPAIKAWRHLLHKTLQEAGVNP